MILNALDVFLERSIGVLPVNEVLACSFVELEDIDGGWKPFQSALNVETSSSTYFASPRLQER